MATPNGGDSDLPNKVCNNINCTTISYEKDHVRAEVPSPRKNSSEPDFKESEDAENFERNCPMCLWAMSWIWEWTIFLSLIHGQKKKQTVYHNRLCFFWSAPRIATSVKVKHHKSMIHGLPVTLHMIRVKSDKSCCLRIRNNYSAHAQKIEPSQRSQFLYM